MRHVIAILVLALQATAASAVTCDFDYQLTPAPQAVGLTIQDTPAGAVMIWYPAEPSAFKQVTDEREPNRMNVRDYYVAAKYGATFRDVDLAERSRYLQESYADWYARGARQIQVTHMLVAVLQARVNATRLKAKGAVIGTIDPILAERLAGHGLVVVNLQSSLLFQPKSQRDALAQQLPDALTDWLGDDADKPRALIVQEEMTPDEIASLADLVSAKTIVINHRLAEGERETPVTQTVLAFQTDDTGDASKQALSQLVEKPRLAVVSIPKLESALLSAAPYEACARLAFSKAVYQGWHLHHRRTVIVAEMLNHLEKHLKVDLELTGTNKSNKQLEAEIGLKRQGKP